MWEGECCRREVGFEDIGENFARWRGIAEGEDVRGIFFDGGR
jgi:hypothetical protein